MPFLKLTISTATNLPKVRDEYLLVAYHTQSLTSLLRIFERGECTFQGFEDVTATYESNMPFILRFMIDTKVRNIGFQFGPMPEIMVTGCRNELG